MWKFPKSWGYPKASTVRPFLVYFSIKAYAFGDPRELRTPHVRICSNLYSSKKWEYWMPAVKEYQQQTCQFCRIGRWGWERPQTNQPHLFLDRVHPTFWGHYPGLTPPKQAHQDLTIRHAGEMRCYALPLSAACSLLHQIWSLAFFLSNSGVGTFFMIICDCSALKLLLWGLLSCWCELPFASGLRSRRLGTGKFFLYISRNSLFQSPCCSQALSNIDQIHRNSIGIWIHISFINIYVIYSCLCNRKSVIHIDLLIY